MIEANAFGRRDDVRFDQQASILSMPQSLQSMNVEAELIDH